MGLNQQRQHGRLDLFRVLTDRELGAHDHALLELARSALLAAQSSTPEARVAALKSAARVLHQETGLECREVLDIVGLDDGTC